MMYVDYIKVQAAMMENNILTFTTLSSSILPPRVTSHLDGEF